MNRRLVLTGLAGTLLPSPGRAAIASGAFVENTSAGRVRVVPVAGGLENPWGFDFLPDGSILVTERVGRIRRIVNGWLLPDPVQGAPRTFAYYQGGLLDLAVHPNAAGNGRVFITKSVGNLQRTTTALVRARWDGDRLVDNREIFRASPMVQSTAHYGSRCLPDGLGHVYMTVGDRRQDFRAQDPNQHCGKVLRLTEDGDAPADNPFVGRPGTRPEIWALGSRNAQGLALQPGTGLLWNCEHGDAGGDELNIVRGGANLGWPIIGYGFRYGGGQVGIGYSRAGLTQPIRYWGPPSVAPSGLSFYQGNAFPAWRGDVLMGALRAQRIIRMKLAPNGTVYRVIQQEYLCIEKLGRVRQVKPGPDGLIYAITDEAPGALWRIEPA